MSSSAQSESPAHILKSLARFLPRLYGPFISYSQMLIHGLTVCAIGPMTEQDRATHIKVLARYRYTIIVPEANVADSHHPPSSSRALVKRHVEYFEDFMQTASFMQELFPYLRRNDEDVKTTHITAIATFVRPCSQYILTCVSLTLVQ